MKLKGKVVLITGGAKRIGREIALVLAKAGARVAVTYRTSEKEALRLIQQMKKAETEAMAIYADVVSASDVANAVKQVLERFHRLDVLVNNAANFLKVPFERLSEKDFDDAIGVNLKGSYLFSVAAGKVMLKRKRGKIINIADWAGMRPYRDYLPYCVSKGGVITLTRALAKSLAPHVQVNAVMPGAVLLPENFSRRERETILRKTPLQRIGSPRDIAESVRFFIEGSDYITGAILPVDGGRLIA